MFLQDIYSNLDFYNYQRKLSKDYNPIFEEAYAEGIKILSEFTRNFKFSILIKAAKKFIEATKINPNIAGPYVFLAWLYLIVDDKNTCYEYLSTAEKIEPNFPGIYRIKYLMPL